MGEGSAAGMPWGEGLGTGGFGKLGGNSTRQHSYLGYISPNDYEVLRKAA